ncbi:MAG: hypothetical protein V1837_00640 [Candidatus Woesearchaeota archaeon]
MQEKKRVVCIDFDGVIASYSGWKGSKHFGKPVRGIKEFLEDLQKTGLSFVVLTSRAPKTIKHYFKKYSIPAPDRVTNVKIPASVYIDDRCIRFDGNFSHLRKDLRTFRVHWKSKKSFDKLF